MGRVGVRQDPHLPNRLSLGIGMFDIVIQQRSSAGPVESFSGKLEDLDGMIVQEVDQAHWNIPMSLASVEHVRSGACLFPWAGVHQRDFQSAPAVAGAPCF